MTNMPPPPPPPGYADTPQDAKARAKAEKAYRKASRPWYRKKRWWLLAVVVVLVVIIAASAGGGGSDDKPTNPNSGVDKGFGSKDASADVTALRLLPPDSIGVRYVEIDVTNHSSKRSNYYIEFSVESADGATKYADGNALVSNLEAGQSTTSKDLASIDKNIPDSAVVKLKTVSRTAA